MPKKPSPQATDIDPEQLDLLLRLKPSLTDCAGFFNCSSKAVERFIRRNYDRTFAEHRELHLSHTRNKLVREAISRGMAGSDSMLIFALKNLCGWSDKHEISGTIGVNSIADLLLSADQDALDVTPKAIEGAVEKP